MPTMRVMTRVLLAEDDASISEPLARALRREGYEVEVCEDGPAALDAGLRRRVDLVVLDLGLPGMDGLEVCRRLRGEGQRRADPGPDRPRRRGGHRRRAGRRRRRLRHQAVPAGRAAGPGAGPAAARRRRAAAAAATHGVRIDVESHRAWMGEEELQLTAKEFDLLRVLVRDAGRVVTRDQLMREVWDTTWWSSTKTLDMHISWLRKKLGDDAAEPPVHHHCARRGVPLRARMSGAHGVV